MNDIGGVWRTIAGRKVFIKDGQSLDEAMKESGKFAKKKNYRDEVNKKEKQIILKDIEQAKKLKETHTFYSKDLEKNFDNMIEDESKNSYLKTKGMIDLDDILKKENRELSESPYSFSLYAVNKGEIITWENKPVGSYRLSDHWNFESRGKTHCKLTRNRKYKQSVILAKFNGETYDIVKEYKKDEE